MATTTTTSPLQFKSHKGGERRAEGTNGSTYSIRRVDDGVFETSVRMPGEKKFTPLGGGDANGARLLADQHYTNSDQGDKPRDNFHPGFSVPMVQAGTSDETVEQVLASIPDPEVEDVRKLVEATNAKAEFEHVPFVDDASKAAIKAAKQGSDKAKRAARKAATPSQPATPVDKLVFEPFKGDEDDQRAKGARHAYKITHAMSGGFYAAQRTCSWTNIAGKCDTFDQAEDLANRYEHGAKQLSHRSFLHLPYAKAIAQLEGGK